MQIRRDMPEVRQIYAADAWRRILVVLKPDDLWNESTPQRIAELAFEYADAFIDKSVSVLEGQAKP